MDPRVKAALSIQRAVFEQLWTVSAPFGGWGADPLPPANGRPVVVRRVPSTALPPIAGSHMQATIMRDCDRYVIFVGAEPVCSPVPGLEGESLERLLVWREHARIAIGEVFEDNPEALLRRWATPDSNGAQSRAERCSLHAAIRSFIDEAERSGRMPAAQLARRWACERGVPTDDPPCGPG